MYEKTTPSKLKFEFDIFNVQMKDSQLAEGNLNPQRQGTKSSTG